MKNKLYILILPVFLLFTFYSNAQQEPVDVDLVIGASLPKLFSCGVRLHYMPKAQLDFNFGSDFKNDENGRLYEITINHAYYFKKNTWRFNKALWSFNTGFSFLIEKGAIEKSSAGYINLFLARDFPIAKKLFIEPQLGLSYFLFEQIVNQENIVRSGKRTLIIPKLGLNLIMKL